MAMPKTQTRYGTRIASRSLLPRVPVERQPRIGLGFLTERNMFEMNNLRRGFPASSAPATERGRDGRQHIIWRTT